MLAGMKTVSSLALLLTFYFYCRDADCNGEDDNNLEILRDRLCSKPDEFLHKGSGVCYPEGAYCSGLMKFYETEGGYGECDCGDRFHTTLIYWSPFNRCYYPYTKGPCPYGEWITLNPETKTAMCKRNPCGLEKANQNLELYSNGRAGSVWFEQFGECWQYDTQGYCPNGYVLWNYKPLVQVTGKCVSMQTLKFKNFGSANTRGIPCKPGQKYSNTRLCRRLVSFRG